MSATELDWAPSRPDNGGSGISGAIRLVLAAVAIGCAVALLGSDQSGLADSIVHWLGLDTIADSAGSFITALSGR